LIVVETGNGSGCSGEPPSDITLAVCNTETGFWEEEYVALDSVTYQEAMLSDDEDVAPVIEIDPVSGELTIEEAPPADEAVADALEEALGIEEDPVEALLEELTPSDPIEELLEELAPADPVEELLEELAPADPVEELLEELAPSDPVEELLEELAPADPVEELLE